MRNRLLSILCVMALLVSCLGVAAAEAIVPNQEELNRLVFVITGPDPRMPMTVTYGEFADGKFELDNLMVGVYTVMEVNAEELLTGYTFDAENSVQIMQITVTENHEATAQLVNVYQLGGEVTPIDPENPNNTGNPGDLEKPDNPDETEDPENPDNPENPDHPDNPDTPVNPDNPDNPDDPDNTENPDNPTEPENPAENEELIAIPVNKIWVDFNNRDKNRPENVTVHLMANGTEIETASLSAETGWQHVFAELPKYAEDDAEIVYTITEDAVDLYSSSVDGYNITNTYEPELTSTSVQKVWNDNDNATGMRPTSLYAVLSNGMTVLLNEENGWSATVNDLPTVVNGQPAVYTWREQEALGYEQTGMTVEGGVTTFTNSLRQRPTPPPNEKVPPTRGDPYTVIDDYETPLGVNIVINHVGDCFD